MAHAEAGAVGRVGVAVEEVDFIRGKCAAPIISLFHTELIRAAPAVCQYNNAWPRSALFMFI